MELLGNPDGLLPTGGVISRVGVATIGLASGVLFKVAEGIVVAVIVTSGGVAVKGSAVGLGRGV